MRAGNEPACAGEIDPRENENKGLEIGLVQLAIDVIDSAGNSSTKVLELGYDKWTNNMYANKEFMLNCVNYLLDDNGLINIRSKEVDLPILDKQKVEMPKSLNIITGTGISYTRNDGINVISLASLGQFSLVLDGDGSLSARVKFKIKDL